MGNTRAAPSPHHTAQIVCTSVPETGRTLEPRFRAQNQAQIPGSSIKSNQNQNHGLDSVPGIWASKCAQIPAQENRWGRPHPSQKTGRFLLHFCPGNLTSSRALPMLGPPPCCRYLGGMGGAHSSLLLHCQPLLRMLQGHWYLNWGACSTGTVATCSVWLTVAYNT